MHAADIVRGVIRIFEAKTMTQHRQVRREDATIREPAGDVKAHPMARPGRLAPPTHLPITLDACTHTHSFPDLQAVEIVEKDLLWDGPPIRLSNKGHLRLAAYLFKVRGKGGVVNLKEIEDRLAASTYTCAVLNQVQAGGWVCLSL